MQVNPYLMFSGQCEAAMNFYARVLGGKILTMATFEGSPAANGVPPEWGKKILHAHLQLGDWNLLASDAPPGRQEKPQGFSLSLQGKEPADYITGTPPLPSGGASRV